MHSPVSRVILTSLVSPLLAGLVLAAPTPDSAQTASCKQPVTRREWRTLSKSTQLQYLDAVKCLQTHPPKYQSDFPGARNRFDDFQGLHINQTDSIHFVGHFQPWHRWFVSAYEKALCGECGYCLGQPYWDWTQDATVDNWAKSPLFDPVYGFGGNGPYSSAPNPLPFTIPGHTGGGCVENGPFKNMTVNMGPGPSIAYNPRCLSRDFNPTFAALKANKTNVDIVLPAKSFAEFDVLVQGGLQPPTFTYHGGGHIGVGGELGVIADVYASPGDPLFFLHHANMDRIWWTWESRDRKARTQDVTGPSIHYTDVYAFGDNLTSPEVTLDFKMNVRDFVPGGVAIRDVMDIQQGLLCYEFDALAN